MEVEPVPKLVRRDGGRVVAGVAGGLADHLGVEVFRVRIVFVVLADIGIVAANLTADMPPEFAIGKTAFLAVLGLVAGIFLDRWMLATHMVLSAGGVTAIIGWKLFTTDVPVLGAMVVWVPVVALTIAIPVLLYTFVRAVRLDQN